MQAVIEDHGQAMRKLMIGDEEKGARSLSVSTEASSSAITNLTSGTTPQPDADDGKTGRKSFECRGHRKCIPSLF